MTWYLLLTGKSWFWICITGAAAAVLASPACLTEIDSLHGILELAAPGTVLPSEPVRSIPTRHTASSMVCSDLSTWRNIPAIHQMNRTNLILRYGCELCDA